jgi:hypothetical protein
MVIDNNIIIIIIIDKLMLFLLPLVASYLLQPELLAYLLCWPFLAS